MKGKPSASRRKPKLTDEQIAKYAERAERRFKRYQPGKRPSARYFTQAAIQPSRILAFIGDAFGRLKLRLSKQKRNPPRNDIVVRVGKSSNKVSKSVNTRNVKEIV